MSSYVEHANITVEDLDSTLAFLGAALPDFKLRHRGCDVIDGDSCDWAHFGSETHYIALQQAKGRTRVDRELYDDVGNNHVGIVVEDVEALKSRVAKLGYVPSSESRIHPARIRVYFDMADGTEWEFIQYLSNDAEKRNDYSA